MDTQTVKRSCPLGGVCQEIKDNTLHRCVGYVKLIGKDPQSEKTYDEYKCALLEWLPILLIENAQTNRGQTAATESFRNEMVKSQNVFNSIMASAAMINQHKQLGNTNDISADSHLG